MFLRAVIAVLLPTLSAVAVPHAVAATPDSRAAGLRGEATDAPARTAAAPVPLAVPGDGPRRYSLHRAYGEKPDPVNLPPEFFLTPGPDLAAPPAEPERDRKGRPVQDPSPDSPSV